MISSSYGLLTFDSGNYVGEQFSFTSTPKELVGFPTNYFLSTHSVGFDQPSDGRLRYTGATTREFIVTARFTGNQEGRWRLEARKNGSLIDSGVNSTCYIDVAGAPGVFELLVSLAQNDYLSIFAAKGGTTTKKISNIYISAFSKD